MEPAPIRGRDFRTAFVLLLVVGMTVLFLAVAWPFLKPLLVGAILAGLCRPLYTSLVKLFRGRKSLASAATLLILIVLIAGPLSAFLGVVIKQAVHVTNQAVPWVR